MKSSVAAADNFFHRAKVVIAHEAFDFEAAVVLAVGVSVLKGHHGGHAEAAGDVRDVEALHSVGLVSERELFFQSLDDLQVIVRADEIALELSCAVGGALECFNAVAQ